MFLCILSNALLMSKRSRYKVSSVDDIVLSVISLVANTCSVCSCLKGVNIRFHPLMTLFFLLLAWLQIHVLLLTYFYDTLLGIWISQSLILN